jgi:diguanylate cyclase (GGDEF)-like protein
LSAVEVKGLWHSIGVIRDISERKQAEEELKRLSYLDGLTGVANRRRFDEALGLEWRRMTRDAKPLSLIMCDIDFFKAYNDTYGHQSGDDSLRQVANTLNSVPGRPGDLVARYGGEEYVVILPETDSQSAKFLAEKMRSRVESLGIIHVSSQVCEVLTISLGVATTIPTSGSLPDELVSAADQALYEAKKEGRNRVNLDE